MIDMEQCPGPAMCPLYILSHDGANGDLGCVRDMAEPCDGSEPEAFRRLLDHATTEVFARMRGRLLGGQA